MISPGDFVASLKKRGVLSFTGVPCSFFQSAINYVIADTSLSYTIVPNEGAALAFASGSYLAGKRTALLIQNSGFGNLINPLTSLNMIYRIPTLIFMSGRAYGVKDEPQHEIIGRTMGPMLQSMGVAFEEMPQTLTEFEVSLDRVLARMDATKEPFVFLVKKDTIEEFASTRPRDTGYPMKRIEAIRVLSGLFSENVRVIATTGKPSRELFAVADRSENFYMQGSMGHAVSIGLGYALSAPKEKVVVLDGDGALLMHLGALSSVGHCRPKNFYHVVLDNESYETTGDQDTTSATTEFCRVAKACGYTWVDSASDAEDLLMKARLMLSMDGPSFLRVKINRLPTDEIPRISSQYNSPDITKNFRSKHRS